MGESSGGAFKVDGTVCVKALWQEAARYVCVANAERARMGNMVLERGTR